MKMCYNLNAWHSNNEKSLKVTLNSVLCFILQNIYGTVVYVWLCNVVF